MGAALAVRLDRERLLDAGDLLAEILLLELQADRDAREREAGDDDRVPVVGGDLGDEQPPAVAGEVIGAGGEHAGVRVELQELAAHLLEHVVGDHDARLAYEPEPLEVARRGAQVERLAGPDGVEQADGGLAEDAGDGGALMDGRDERLAHPRERQTLPVGGEVAQHQAVEQLVVGVQQRLRALLVLPDPLREALGDRLRLLDRRGGLIGVEDAALPVDRVDACRRRSPRSG